MERNEREDVHSSDSPLQMAIATSLVEKCKSEMTDEHGGQSNNHKEHLEAKDSEIPVAISLDCFDEDEAWEDSVKKCKHGKLDRNEGEDSHHSEYLETSDPHVEGIIKERIRIMFDDGDVYRDTLSLLLKQEYDILNKTIVQLKGPEENLPENLRISSSVLSIPRLLELYHNAVEIAVQKRKDREARALQYFHKELDNVTRDIMRRIDGVVRVQRKTTACREHGTGTGIVVRVDWSGTCFTPRKYARALERDDFAILTNNHVIANDIEVKGSTIDFFYNCSAGNKTQGQPPSGIITKSVKQVITWSPRVSHGTPASREEMDFSILKFDVGTDEEFIKKLGDVSFYLNEFLENDLTYNRPWIPYSSPLPLVAISHPHGSNKRISFGRVEKTGVDKLCSEDNVDCSSEYNLTTCLGSSGCPVLAIQVNSRGHLKAVLQFLHFKTRRGIAVSEVYNVCKIRKEIKDEYQLFDSVLNSRDMMFATNKTAVWWDTEERKFWGFF